MTNRPGAYARFLPSLVGLAVFGAFALLWMSGAHDTYERLLTLWGVVPFRVPFVDIDGPLSLWDCARRGIVVIAANPCDIQHRPFDYSPVLLSFAWIPLGGADRVWLGPTLDVAFLISLSGVPPPLSRGETGLRIAATLSTMTVFAVERTNVDIVVFLAAIVMIRLLTRSSVSRLAGYGLAFLAGSIKYYPFVLLGLVATEPRRYWLPLTAAASFGFGMLLVYYGAQGLQTLDQVPQGAPFGDMIGGVNVLLGAFIVAHRYITSISGAAEAASTILLLALIIVLWAVAELWRHSDVPAALFGLDAPRRLALLAGCLLLAGCFVAGQSIGYRGIFLLLLQPALSAFARDPAIGMLAACSRRAAIGLPILMSAEALRLWLHLAGTGQFPVPGFIGLHDLDQPLDLLSWAMREAAWWALMSLILSVLLAYAVETVSAALPWLNLAARRASR